MTLVRELVPYGISGASAGAVIWPSLAMTLLGAIVNMACRAHTLRKTNQESRR